MQHAGCEINVGDIVFEPPRDGPTLWEIGIPDRSAAEFYVPEPNPKFINKLFIDHPDKLVTLPILGNNKKVIVRSQKIIL